LGDEAGTFAFGGWIDATVTRVAVTIDSRVIDRDIPQEGAAIVQGRAGAIISFYRGDRIIRKGTIAPTPVP
jgi:hypothetical protein